MGAINRVLIKWRDEGVHLLPPHDDAHVREIVGSLGRGLSRDVTELYCATGGMPDGEMDSLCLSLWPLDRVASESQEYEHAGILFADFLIDSHQYLFRYEDAEASSVHVDYGDGKLPQRVADSLEDFFELYLTRPEKIGL